MTCVKCKTSKSENKEARICDTCWKVRQQKDTQEEVRQTTDSEWLEKIRTSYRGSTDPMAHPHMISDILHTRNGNCFICDRSQGVDIQCLICNRAVHKECTIPVMPGICVRCHELAGCIESWDQGRVRSSWEKYPNPTALELINTSFQALCGLSIMNSMPRALDLLQALPHWSEQYQEMRSSSVEVKKVIEKGYRGSDMGEGLFASNNMSQDLMVAVGSKGSLHLKDCKIAQGRISNLKRSNPGAHCIEVLHPNLAQPVRPDIYICWDSDSAISKVNCVVQAEQGKEKDRSYNKHFKHVNSNFRPGYKEIWEESDNACLAMKSLVVGLFTTKGVGRGKQFMCPDYTNWGGSEDIDPSKLTKWKNVKTCLCVKDRRMLDLRWTEEGRDWACKLNVLPSFTLNTVGMILETLMIKGGMILGRLMVKGEPKAPTKADGKCRDVGVLITCIEYTDSASQKKVHDARTQVIQVPWGKTVGSGTGNGAVSSLRFSPLKFVITLQRELWYKVPDVLWLPSGASSTEVPSLTGMFGPAEGGVRDLWTDLRPGVLVLAGQGTVSDWEDCYTGRSSLRMQLPAALDYGEDLGDDRTPQVTLQHGFNLSLTDPVSGREDQRNEYLCETPFLTSGVIVSAQCWDNRQGIFMCTQEITIGEVVRYYAISDGTVKSGSGLLIGVNCESAENSGRLCVWIHRFKSDASSSRLLPSRDYLCLQLGQWAQGEKTTVCFIMRDGAASDTFWDGLKEDRKLAQFLKPVVWAEFEAQEDERKRSAIFAQYWNVDDKHLPTGISERIRLAYERKKAQKRTGPDQDPEYVPESEPEVKSKTNKKRPAQESEPEVKSKTKKKRPGSRQDTQEKASETNPKRQNKPKRQKGQERETAVSEKKQWLDSMLQNLRAGDCTSHQLWQEFASFGRLHMGAPQKRLSKYWKVLCPKSIRFLAATAPAVAPAAAA